MSCDDILDVEPQGKLTFEQFWQSNEHAVAAIAGLYSYLGSTAHDLKTANMSATAISPVESYVYWGDLRGDLLAVNPGKYAADQVNKENIDNLNTAPGDVTTKFTQFYKIINQANQAIKYIPGIKSKDPAFTDEKELMGEAYFVRGFVYFWLARTFREVPLVLVPSESDVQDYNQPKVTMDALFDQIESDLETAKTSLPVWYDNQVYSRCRATRYTAMAVLADVYLWRASLTNDAGVKSTYYDKVISNCNDIIDSRKYVLIPGVNYGSIFTQGTSDETIFESYANSLLNNQRNNLRSWFTATGFWLVPNNVDELFSYTTLADYRSAVPPAGPVPEKGAVVSYSPSSRYIAKYSSNTNDARWIYYRYPEILLMKAEALAHRYEDHPDRLAEAADLINTIRSRAYGISSYPKVMPSTTYEMDNAILDERARELIGEGKRWFELVRFATRDNFRHKELLVDRVLASVSGVQQLTLAPRLVNQESWYLPLNADALASNPKLEQNPYYN
ncbi:MAG: RagB/SusD family nutrient uptake outer membrane protein [Dysgonamonadaceae bacterium]|jgi:hypothetical protein|nr:RagB/SusD family nutrient uptake outer membrane protein [Dysgonamonadaceae bacterium]